MVKIKVIPVSHLDIFTWVQYFWCICKLDNHNCPVAICIMRFVIGMIGRFYTYHSLVFFNACSLQVTYQNIHQILSKCCYLLIPCQSKPSLMKKA